jgi:hypothetical protein
MVVVGYCVVVGVKRLRSGFILGGCLAKGRTVLIVSVSVVGYNMFVDWDIIHLCIHFIILVISVVV